MNEEFLVDLAEAMLNEGIDEGSIIRVLSSLVEEQEEVLPVSESCFNSIVNLTEAIINELLAPNDERAKAVLDRKADQLDANMRAHYTAAKRVKEFVDNADTFHKRHPKATSKDMLNTHSLLRDKAQKIDAKGDKLLNGAKRLTRWAADNAQAGKVSGDVKDSAHLLTGAGNFNDFVRGQHRKKY